MFKIPNHEQYLLNNVHRYLIHPEFIEKNNCFNNLFNIIFPLCISIPWFLGKITLIDFLFFSAVAYIFYDFVGIFLDKIIFFIYFKFVTISMKKKYSFYNTSDLEEELQSKIKQKKKISKQIDKEDADPLECSLEIARLEAEIEECKKHINDANDLENDIQDLSISLNDNEFKSATYSLDRLREYAPNVPNGMKKQFSSILHYGDKIVSIAQDNPSVMNNLNQTFNIYFPELISLMNDYKLIKNEEKEKYTKTIKEILNLFEKHMKHLEEQTETEWKIKFEINSSLLKESLEGERKEKKECIEADF